MTEISQKWIVGKFVNGFIQDGGSANGPSEAIQQAYENIINEDGVWHSICRPDGELAFVVHGGQLFKAVEPMDVMTSLRVFWPVFQLWVNR